MRIPYDFMPKTWWGVAGIVFWLVVLLIYGLTHPAPARADWLEDGRRDREIRQIRHDAEMASADAARERAADRMLVDWQIQRMRYDLKQSQIDAEHARQIEKMLEE